jgi:hypothetical protein
VRSIKFKHVRFNRVNARLTYEGPPLSISGFGLVLDNRVYRNIDGGWKTVLNRYALVLVWVLLYARVFEHAMFKRDAWAGGFAAVR